VAGRFPLLADACVNDYLVQGLKARGWDVVRAVDLYPEATKDEVLFARAAAEGRVFVTNDRPADLCSGVRPMLYVSRWRDHSESNIPERFIM
jgi:predicted nuclease of predicted toxin-antitoxin system